MAIIITREKIRRRTRRAALTALVPALVSGLIAGVFAGMVADTPTAVAVIATGLAALLAALFSAGLSRSPTLWRSAGVSASQAPTWFTYWLPILAILLCCGFAAGVGLVIAALMNASLAIPAVIPLVVGGGLALLFPRQVRNRPPASSAPAPVSPPVARRVERKPAVVTRTGVTVHTPRQSKCPAGCGQLLKDGERFMVCSQTAEHKVHASCGTALCFSICPECKHPLR